MKTLYATGEGGKRCPGEADCTRFQASSEPKSDACVMCELLPTKPTLLAENDERMVAHINRLARSRDSGYPVSLEEMTPTEWMLLRLLDDHVDAHERQLRIVRAGMAGVE